MAKAQKNDSPNTVLVEKQKRWKRVDFLPCNPLAEKILKLLKQKSFSAQDLNSIDDLGYDVRFNVPKIKDLK